MSVCRSSRSLLRGLLEESQLRLLFFENGGLEHRMLRGASANGDLLAEISPLYVVTIGWVLRVPECPGPFGFVRRSSILREASWYEASPEASILGCCVGAEDENMELPRFLELLETGCRMCL